MSDERFTMEKGIHGGRPWTRKNTCAPGKAQKKVLARMAARTRQHERAIAASSKWKSCLDQNRPGSLAKARVA